VDSKRRMTGIIYSDTGLASSFMALAWVQEALKQSLGFLPFPATLNVHPKAIEDARLWEAVQTEFPGMPLPPCSDGFCNARLYPVEIQGSMLEGGSVVKGAVLLPDVGNYPKDKIEIVAPTRLKEAFGVRDGDSITLEFIT
jgi:riboflavin kinase